MKEDYPRSFIYGNIYGKISEKNMTFTFRPFWEIIETDHFRPFWALF